MIPCERCGAETPWKSTEIDPRTYRRFCGLCRKQLARADATVNCWQHSYGNRCTRNGWVSVVNQLSADLGAKGVNA